MSPSRTLPCLFVEGKHTETRCACRGRNSQCGEHSPRPLASCNHRCRCRFGVTVVGAIRESVFLQRLKLHAATSCWLIRRVSPSPFWFVQPAQRPHDLKPVGSHITPQRCRVVFTEESGKVNERFLERAHILGVHRSTASNDPLSKSLFVEVVLDTYQASRHEALVIS